MTQLVALQTPDDWEQHRRMTPPFRAGLPQQFDVIGIAQGNQFGALGHDGRRDAVTVKRVAVLFHPVLAAVRRGWQASKWSGVNSSRQSGLHLAWNRAPADDLAGVFPREGRPGNRPALPLRRLVGSAAFPHRMKKCGRRVSPPATSPYQGR
jgi:hypothetical protein